MNLIVTTPVAYPQVVNCKNGVILTIGLDQWYENRSLKPICQCKNNAYFEILEWTVFNGERAWQWLRVQKPMSRLASHFGPLIY